MICCSSLLLECHRCHPRRYLFFPPKNIRSLREASVFGFHLLVVACPCCWQAKKSFIAINVCLCGYRHRHQAIMAHLLAVLRRVLLITCDVAFPPKNGLSVIRVIRAETDQTRAIENLGSEDRKLLHCPMLYCPTSPISLAKERIKPKTTIRHA